MPHSGHMQTREIRPLALSAASLCPPHRKGHFTPTSQCLNCLLSPLPGKSLPRGLLFNSWVGSAIISLTILWTACSSLPFSFCHRQTTLWNHPVYVAGQNRSSTRTENSSVWLSPVSLGMRTGPRMHSVLNSSLGKWINEEGPITEVTLKDIWLHQITFKGWRIECLNGEKKKKERKRPEVSLTGNNCHGPKAQVCPWKGSITTDVREISRRTHKGGWCQGTSKQPSLKHSGWRLKFPWHKICWNPSSMTISNVLTKVRHPHVSGILPQSYDFLSLIAGQEGKLKLTSWSK